MTTNPTQSSGQTVREILDNHAEWYVRRTMDFYNSNETEPNFIKGTNEFDVKSEAAINSYVVSVLEDIEIQNDGTVDGARQMAAALDAAISQHKGEDNQ